MKKRDRHRALAASEILIRAGWEGDGGDALIIRVNLNANGKSKILSFGAKSACSLGWTRYAAFADSSAKLTVVSKA